MPVTEAVANPRPPQAQCGPPLLPRVGGGSRPQILGVFAKAEAPFIVHRGSQSCQIVPAPSVSLRCNDGGLQAMPGGQWFGVGATPLVSPCPPGGRCQGGSQHPGGREEGRQGLGVLVGAASKFAGTPQPLLQWEGLQRHPHPMFSRPPLAQHPEGVGWAGGRSRGGHVRPAQPSPFPLGKLWLPVWPSSRVCSHILPKHQGLCCPLPTRPRPGGVQHLPLAPVLPVQCRRGRTGSGAAATLVRGHAQLPGSCDAHAVQHRKRWRKAEVPCRGAGESFCF